MSMFAWSFALVAAMMMSFVDGKWRWYDFVWALRFRTSRHTLGFFVPSGKILSGQINGWFQSDAPGTSATSAFSIHFCIWLSITCRRWYGILYCWIRDGTTLSLRLKVTVDSGMLVLMRESICWFSSSRGCISRMSCS
ncbi:hypothetical protein BDR26DRAFT_874174 [Obelidium mucronatum]|nr:hypothetical protein BDR26DRAFT_874174 [Obelidium mucronatum]